MRALSSQALAIIAEKHGTEPISVVEIQFSPPGLYGAIPGSAHGNYPGGVRYYSDRNISESDFSGYTPSPTPPRLLVEGKVLEIGSLDDAVDLTHHKASSEISIKLDDTDGSLKQLMDTSDLHLKKVRLWQFFAGMTSFADKFLVFSGVVASPVTWSEHDRTLSFNALSRLQDQEIGFSAECGQFMYLPYDLVGKAWPMAFGTPVSYPALQITRAVKGILGSGLMLAEDYIGHQALWEANNTRVVLHMPDENKPDQRVAEIQYEFLGHCQMLYDEAAMSAKNSKISAQLQTKADEIQAQADALNNQMQDKLNEWQVQQTCRENAALNAYYIAKCKAGNQITKQLAQEQLALDAWYGNANAHTVTIYGGEDFPQDQQLTLSIGGAYWIGVMHGNQFTWTYAWNPAMQQAVINEANHKFTPLPCLGVPPTPDCQQARKKKPIHYHFEMQVPPSQNVGGKVKSANLETYVIDGDLDPPDSENATTKDSTSSGGSSETGQIGVKVSTLYINAGAAVTIVPDPEDLVDVIIPQPTILDPQPVPIPINPKNISCEPMYYVASIVPGKILAVQAYKSDVVTVRQLVDIPAQYYQIKDITYGPITAKMVVLNQPLSSYQETDNAGNIISQGWEETVYITYQSDIGPNIIDVIEYILQTYTTFTWDTASFNHCRTVLAKFPVNFPVLEKKNILQFLEEVGYQSRCAIWLKDDVVFMKYLAEEPIADDTITESDIDFDKGISVEFTTTEDLITRYTCTWHLDWADREKYIFILRHNVAKYGIMDDAYDFYMYNQPDIIYKVATFWMIRRSNTWKRVKFSTFLNKLNLETFDTVLLDFGSRDYVASNPMKAVVEKAAYNSDTKTIDFECLVPVKAGTMTQYPFFWPASLPIDTKFPTAEEIAEGWAGGNSIGEEAYGILPIGYTPAQGGTIIIGGINIGFGPHSDWGDRSPTDIGFTAQNLNWTTANSNSVNGQRTQIQPLPAMQPTHLVHSPFKPMDLPAIPLGLTLLDIHDSLISDNSKGNMTFLDTFFREVNDDNKLVGDTAALWGDSQHSNKAAKKFDFKYDDIDTIFGAGTAFLKND